MQNTQETQTQQRWYQSQKLAFSLVIMTLLSLFGILIHGSQNSSRKPSLVILKSDGCAFLHQQQIATQPVVSGNICTLTGPFIPDLIGNGGVIQLADRQLSIADKQIIAVEEIEDRARTSQQHKLFAWVGVNFILLIGTIVWLLITLF